MSKPLNIDANLRNADWTKQSWDLSTPDGKPVTTYDQLVAALGTKLPVAKFVTLPAAQAMPAALRADLAAHGVKVPTATDPDGDGDTGADTDNDGDGPKPDRRAQIAARLRAARKPKGK